MAKLERKTQRIFAENANASDISAFGTTKTGMPEHTIDVNRLQNTNFTQGWDVAIKNDKAPYLGEMNGVQYTITRQLSYLYQQGIAEWDINTTYYTGSYVTYNGKIYISKTDDNLGHAISETTYWEEYGKDFMQKDFSNATSSPWLTMLNVLFPVGAIYCGKMTNCPLESLIPGSIWQKVAQDRCLQGAGSLWGAGVNIAQTAVNHFHANSVPNFTPVNYQIGPYSVLIANGQYSNTSNADTSSSVYRSNRNQPNAYTTNIWERIA